MTRTGILGLCSGAAILAAALAAILALIGVASSDVVWGAGDWAALRFTLVQALLSTVGSVAVALPLARALARRRFRGRDLLVTAMGAPFLLPVLVAVLGLLAIWGRNGALSALLVMAGAERLNIYGLTGVVMAHMFFNIPLVTRLVLQGWATIPAEHLRLAAQLDFGAGARWRLIEWPMLRTVLPGAALLVFLLCITSFSIALTLGGGPAATTIELAIYQAIRFDFDLPRAGVLALVQTGLCLVVAGLLMAAGRAGEARGGMIAPQAGLIRAGRWIDIPLIIGVALFLATPLAAVIWRGLPALPELPHAVIEAAVRSVAVALASATLAVLTGTLVAIGLAGLGTRYPALARAGEGAMLIVLAISPFVLATGWFVILRGRVDLVSLALPMVVVINALMALPFVLRSLVPAVALALRTDGRLAASLGFGPWARARHVLLPHLRAPAGFAAGLAAALSMGDLGVIALFGSTETATLPLVMYQLMGAYRMDAAASAALLLLGLSFGLFAVLDRMGRAG